MYVFHCFLSWSWIACSVMQSTVTCSTLQVPCRTHETTSKQLSPLLSPETWSSLPFSTQLAGTAVVTPVLRLSGHQLSTPTQFMLKSQQCTILIPWRCVLSYEIMYDGTSLGNSALQHLLHVCQRMWKKEGLLKLQTDKPQTVS